MPDRAYLMRITEIMGEQSMRYGQRGTAARQPGVTSGQTNSAGVSVFRRSLNSGCRWLLGAALLGSSLGIFPEQSRGVAGAAEPAAEKTAAWSLQEGDRVVLLGNTFIERENTYGLIEMSLRLAVPERAFTLRNLGWSGDNVLGESRAYFGPVSAGYAHIQEYINLLKPTLVLVSYGHNVAFEGREAVEPFLNNYRRLLRDLSADGRRIVVLGLTPLEPIHRDAATVRQLNQTRGYFNERIQQMCVEQGLPYVDLHGPLLQAKSREQLAALTDNGVHLNEEGYRLAGEVLVESLGKQLSPGLLRDSQFQALSQPLREKVLWKNELFFHRFRPQNETYLRGFRKHEQGQNAQEIYEFDDLVQQTEQTLQPLSAELMQTWTGKTTKP